MKALAAAALAILALAGCGSSGYDAEAHRAAFEGSVGGAVPDRLWQQYQETVRGTCGLTKMEFMFAVASTMDNDPEGLPTFKQSTEFMCPEKLPLIKEVEEL